MNRYVNDKPDDFTIYGYASGIFRNYAIASGTYVPQDPAGTKSGGTIPYVLYIR